MNKLVKVFTLVLLVGFVFPVHAATIAKIGSEELVNKAELIFEGRVVALESQKASSGYIYTYITFEVDEVLVGTLATAGSLTLRFTGGTVNGTTLDVGAVFPELNEKGIYFVEQVAPGLINPLLGWSQGHFTITNAGTVVAGNKQPVQSVSRMSVSALQISQDVADGIETDASANTQANGLAGGMSVDDFKSEIFKLKR